MASARLNSTGLALTSPSIRGFGGLSSWRQIEQAVRQVFDVFHRLVDADHVGVLRVHVAQVHRMRGPKPVEASFLDDGGAIIFAERIDYQGADAPLLPEACIPTFIAHSEQRLGEATFRTPRTTIKAFVGLLAVLEQNEAADWRVLLERTEVEAEQAAADAGVSDELASLTL